MRALVLLLFGLTTAGAAAAQSGPRCDVSNETKNLIVSALCGAAAKEREYKIEGPNCIQESTRVRFLDSATQIVAYRKCGDSLFSDRLKDATVKAARFIQVLANCSNERLDVQRMMDQAVANIEAKAGTLQCTPDMQQLLARKKPEFETLIRQSNDTAMQERIFSKLKIAVDAAGNVTQTQ